MSPTVIHESDGVTVTEWHEPEKEEIVMFEKPWQWITDLFYRAIYALGAASAVVIVAMALGYFCARYL